MKKFFKKLLAVALVVALSNAGVTAEKAEAATCSKHEDYYNEEAGANFYYYKHSVKVTAYVIGEDGRLIDLGNLTGESYYVTCEVTGYDVCVNVRCTECKLKIGTYYYKTPEKHSYCKDDMSE